MVSAGVNYLAVLVSGVVYFALGALWYQRWLFGNAWLKGIGKSPEQAKADYSFWNMVWALIGSLIAAYGIARILSYTHASSWLHGVLIAALAAICFVLVTMGINNAMEKRPCRLFYINGIYNLIGFIIMGAIIGGWH